MKPRIVAQISPEHLEHNALTLSQYAGAPILFPIKANAYGHNAPLMVQATRHLPHIWGYAVATTAEALSIAPHSHKPIVILTPQSPEEQAQALTTPHIRLTVSSIAEIAALPEGSRIHLKINTGMNRLGVRMEQLEDVLRFLQVGNVVLEGVCSHFSNSEAQDLHSAKAQLERFQQAREQVLQAGFQPLFHLSNSGGVESFGAEAAFDLIRPGIAMYGFNTIPHSPIVLKPVMRLLAKVGYIQQIQTGESVSYGELWHAEQPSTLAVLQMGYADGYLRNATHHAHAIIQNQLRPIRGRICMDQCMLDVTGLDVQVGDYAEMWGWGEITAETVAAWGGTIQYELFTRLGSRVHYS